MLGAGVLRWSNGGSRGPRSHSIADIRGWGVQDGAGARFSVRASVMPRVRKSIEAVDVAAASDIPSIARLGYQLALGVLCALLLIAPARAQILGLMGRSDYDALYQRVLHDPKNVRLTLQYAQLAKDRGDYEAAIAAYEKLLLFNPDLPDVQYELAVVYYSLESYAAAKSYFDKVATSPRISSSLRDNTAAYLKELERKLSPTHFSGYLNTGLRYQTNANFGSSAGIGQFSGQDFILQPALAKKPDWNAYVLNDLFFAQDFGSGGDRFEISLSDYYAKQFQSIRSIWESPSFSSDRASYSFRNISPIPRHEFTGSPTALCSEMTRTSGH